MNGASTFLRLLINYPRSLLRRHQHSAQVTGGTTIFLQERPTVITNFENGEKCTGPFSTTEMERRLGLLRAHMSANNLDACILTSYHNVNYFSSFLYTAFGRPYGLVVTHDDSTSVSALIDGGQPWRRTYGSNIIYTDWRCHNYYRALKSLLARCEKSRVGVETDSMSVDSIRLLRNHMPLLRLVDVSRPTMQMRMVKSEEELALIREGARIADLGGATAVEAIEVGVPEFQVAMHARNVMVTEIAATFPNSELMDTWVWFQSGVNTDGAHNPQTSRRLQNGDILSLNCFPMISGYYTALERTMFLGHIPTDVHKKYWEDNCAVHKRGIELIEPGVRCKDIVAELNDMYNQFGLLQYRTFGYGHSFGSLCHYYGREADIELREDVDTELEPGMVLSMEPMILIPEGQPGAGGYREHDILIVTCNGAENITKFPYGPQHNVIMK